VRCLVNSAPTAMLIWFPPILAHRTCVVSWIQHRRPCWSDFHPFSPTACASSRQFCTQPPTDFISTIFAHSLHVIFPPICLPTRLIPFFFPPGCMSALYFLSSSVDWFFQIVSLPHLSLKFTPLHPANKYLIDCLCHGPFIFYDLYPNSFFPYLPNLSDPVYAFRIKMYVMCVYSSPLPLNLLLCHEIVQVSST